MPRRGLCGDVFLEGTPAGARIVDAKVDTSVRKQEVTLDAALEGLAPDASYLLHARVTAEGKLVRECTSDPFQMRDLHEGRIAFSEKSMHTINFYPNFVPPQEMSDWFEHWSTAGVKPVFTCEYGAPFSWDMGHVPGLVPRRTVPGHCSIPDGQLAGLPDLGSVGDLSLGTCPILETAGRN